MTPTVSTILRWAERSIDDALLTFIQEIEADDASPSDLIDIRRRLKRIVESVDRVEGYALYRADRITDGNSSSARVCKFPSELRY
jgi:hypothetical protein